MRDGECGEADGNRWRNAGWWSAMLLVGVLVAAGCNPEPGGDRGFDAAGNDAMSGDTGGEVDAEPLTKLGEVCVEDADCASGTCGTFGEKTVCTTSCSEGDGTCSAAGMSCLDGECVPGDYCKDNDGDGYGDGPGCMDTDCDDENADVHPGATELCGNATDDNCNGEVDEGFETLGETCTAGEGTCQATGTMECSEDGTSMSCSAEAKDPGQEICDGLDNDCDGAVDNQLNCRCQAGETQPCYTGAPDTRGEGVCADGMQTCKDDGSWGKCMGDQLPQKEVCDGKDNSCSGIKDDVDGDNDGYFGCKSAAQRDCDDSDSSIHPGASEQCNKIDDNCNGLVDENSQNIYYLDNDGDGWGQEAKKQSACSPPNNYVDKVGDCNDLNKDIHPMASETCNDIDDDCDANVDEGLPQKTIYRDVDNDGYAPSGARSRKKCLYDRNGDGKGDTSPVGWTTDTGDCDDTDATLHPNAKPLCDGKDNNCDGIVDRWCGSACSGNWPVNMPGNGSPRVVVGDFEQDGSKEIGATHQTAGKLVDAKGKTLWSKVTGLHFAREAGTFADVDGSYAGSKFTMEWVFAPNSSLAFLEKTSSGYNLVDSGIRVYDNGNMMVRDIDNDGQVEAVSSRWQPAMRVAEYNPKKHNFELRAQIDTPDGQRIYGNGVALTDVNGDDKLEVVFGSGHGRRAQPGRWSGNLYAFGLGKNYKPFDACKGCYDTSFKKYFPMTVGRMFAQDSDADGVQNLHVPVNYAKTDKQGQNNATIGWHRQNFNATSGTRLSGPTKGYTCMKYDDDGDGKAECNGYRWTHDVDADGDEDRVVIRNGNVRLEMWENGQWKTMPAGAKVPGGSVRYLGDLQDDGQLDALVSGNGQLHCFSFGKQTHHPWKSHGAPVDSIWTQRTYQRDNWEPNDSKKDSFRVYDEERYYRGFVTSSSDVDWYEIGMGNGWCADARIQAPDSFAIEAKLYGSEDKNNDGKDDLLSSETIQPGKRGRLRCRDTPNSFGQAHFWLEIRGKGNKHSATDYYKAKFRVNF